MQLWKRREEARELDLGFRIYGLGSKVKIGFRVWDLELRVWGLGIKV